MLHKYMYSVNRKLQIILQYLLFTLILEVSTPTRGAGSMVNTPNRTTRVTGNKSARNFNYLCTRFSDGPIHNEFSPCKMDYLGHLKGLSLKN